MAAARLGMAIRPHILSSVEHRPRVHSQDRSLHGIWAGQRVLLSRIQDHASRSGWPSSLVGALQRVRDLLHDFDRQRGRTASGISARPWQLRLGRWAGHLRGHNGTASCFVSDAAPLAKAQVLTVRFLRKVEVLASDRYSGFWKLLA